MSVKVGVVQFKPVLGKPEKNVSRALSLLDSKEADLYVLPELAVEGYHFSTKKQVFSLSSKAGEGSSFSAFLSFAKKKKAYIVYGFAEKSGRSVYNAACCLGPKGIVGVYRKTHLFDREKLFFKPGNTGFPVYHLPFGKIGLMICFDWFFPEAMRTLVLKGAELVAHPSNLVLPHCPDAMITRCLENHVYAVTSNRVGTEKRGNKSLKFIGRSQIISPKGNPLVRLKSEEGVGIANCDLKKSLEKKVTFYNDLIKDRRPTFYEV